MQDWCKTNASISLNQDWIMETSIVHLKNDFRYRLRKPPNHTASYIMILYLDKQFNLIQKINHSNLDQLGLQGLYRTSYGLRFIVCENVFTRLVSTYLSSLWVPRRLGCPSHRKSQSQPRYWRMSIPEHGPYPPSPALGKCLMELRVRNSQNETCHLDLHLSMRNWSEESGQSWRKKQNKTNIELIFSAFSK